MVKEGSRWRGLLSINFRELEKQAPGRRDSRCKGPKIGSKVSLFKEQADKPGWWEQSEKEFRKRGRGTSCRASRGKEPTFYSNCGISL